MILANGMVMTDSFELVRCDIRIENEKIVELGENLQGDERMDMTGMTILPGFIDTHIHGACGTRISDDDAALARITRFEATQGVTGIAITTASSEFSDILRQIDAAAAVKANEGTKILGIHAEGPFLCKKYKGAMNEEYIIAPQKELLDQMLEHAGGLLKIITVAPEAEGAEKFIRYAVQKGLKVSMGHTNATYDEAMAGIAAGATRMTHTFNAARPLNHRDPGVLGAALTEPAVTCEMICDHVHLHPAIMQLMYRTKGADRISVISDSGHAAGWEIKEFMVDGQMRYVVDGVVRLANGTIAGSAKTVLDGVKNLVTGGVPLGDVSRMASLTPARALGLDTVTGSIAPGKLADLVVMDDKLNVASTFVNGACVYRAQ